MRQQEKWFTPAGSVMARVCGTWMGTGEKGDVSQCSADSYLFAGEVGKWKQGRKEKNIRQATALPRFILGYCHHITIVIFLTFLDD